MQPILVLKQLMSSCHMLEQVFFHHVPCVAFYNFKTQNIPLESFLARQYFDNL